MFRHLRTKLTVLYAGLFAAIMLLIAGLALAAMADNARRVVRSELATSSLVFQRVWAQRAGQLETDGILLARDFGFRTAVASHDLPTIRSALENLEQRLGVQRAMIIAPDGGFVSADEDAPAPDVRAVRALQGDDVVSGVLPLGGAPYEAVSVPIMPGSAAGWVVFAARLDRNDMAALQSMAAIPLTASVAYQTGDGRWRDNTASGRPVPARTADFLNAAATRSKAPPATLAGPHGPAMAAATPLNGLVPGRPAMLLLHYPLSKVMAPYRLLFGLLIGVGVLGFAVLVVGTWALARSVTRPVSLLEEAARRLQRGERVTVEATTQDEIGRLAEGFNAMAAEIHQRERELESARDQAEAANRAKSTFLANMSHEVRTPLNGVIGIAGVLSGTPLNGDQKRMVGVIQNSASVLQRVLDDVLDLARVEAGHLQIVEEDFDLGAAVRALAEGTRVQCEAKGLAFELLMAPEAERCIAGDRVRLEQILGNLLSNAVKFTERGRVVLTVSAELSGARFEVRDTGIGFDPSTAAQLFRPFQQADGSITRKYGGAGLGLSISRELARAMGGDLVAAAVLGEGATFTLTVPLAAARQPPASAGEPAQVSELAEDRPLRILVADDHETNRTVARLILEGAGIEVVCVEDGAQAVDAFREGGFDVVFMDMQMPVMDGLSAIRAIRQDERASGRQPTPILMLSANAMPEHVEAAHAAGADGHVAKPITPPRLIAAVEQALSLGEPREAGAVAV